LIPLGGERAAFPFVVAIEADPGRTRAGAGSRPPLLSRSDAQQLLAHLSADLKAMLDGIRKCRLAASGALFDQCQILRPGTPVFSALAQAVRTAPSDGSSPGLAAVGAEADGMPDKALEPEIGIPLGILQLIPLLAEGPADLVEELARDMEHRFLGEGQLSAHTASWIEAAFGVGLAHARFMTLTDLNAMLRLQLEHFGFLPLWELLDAALTGRDDAAEWTTERGGRYAWRDGQVRVVFETFDHWSNHGLGQAMSAEGDDLPRGYAAWNRELRRYSSTLSAHQVPLSFELPPDARGEVHQNYLFEETSPPERPGTRASITEHSWPDLGIVAITARVPGALRHYYPLRAEGLNDIHEAVRALELSGEGVAFPGRMELGQTGRRLRAAVFD
ncbi:MAG: hypothetical protein R3212_13115, partial [Xanthomonadales bacterium]|nr:hypothetical protein [Xanthomonadales bacterium]